MTAQKGNNDKPAASPATKPVEASPRPSKIRRDLTFLLHITVIGLAALMIAYITYDTLLNVSFTADPRYLRLQFWACLVFMVDVIVETFMARRKLHFFLTHLFFLLICVPYLNIVAHFGIHISAELSYILRFLPMIRAAYVLAIVCGGISKNWVQSLFSLYIILLVTMVYFCSLMFFVDEHYLNPGVKSYWDALYWSVMSLTTVGCNINAVTPTGKVISVVLSAGGLILFPIFTVFLTNRLTTNNTSQKS